MLFLLLPFLSYANSSEEYCFSSSTRASEVAKKVRSILLPVDSLTINAACFVIQVPEHRRELVQNYVRRIDPSASINYSSAEIKREVCTLKVEKIKQKQNDQLNASVGSNLEASAQEGNLQASETVQITTIDQFQLHYQDQIIEGNCRFITPSRYEITLKASSNTSGLQTQIQLNSGERKEVGSMLKSSDKSDQSINIPNGASFTNSEQRTQEQVFLSIN